MQNAEISNMLPVFSADYAIHGLRCNSIFPSERSMSFSFSCSRPYSENILRCKLYSVCVFTAITFWVLLSPLNYALGGGVRCLWIIIPPFFIHAAPATLGDRVSVIVPVRTEEEVIGIYADRVVACMTHKEPLRITSVGEVEGHARSYIVLTPEADPASVVAMQVPQPLPTLPWIFVFPDQTPEESFLFGAYGRHRYKLTFSHDGLPVDRSGESCRGVSPLRQLDTKITTAEVAYA